MEPPRESAFPSLCQLRKHAGQMTLPENSSDTQNAQWFSTASTNSKLHIPFGRHIPPIRATWDSWLVLVSPLATVAGACLLMGTPHSLRLTCYVTSFGLPSPMKTFLHVFKRRDLASLNSSWDWA